MHGLEHTWVGFLRQAAWERLSCYGLTGAVVVWFNFLHILAWLPSFQRQGKACLSLCPGSCQPGWLREAGTAGLTHATVIIPMLLWLPVPHKAAKSQQHCQTLLLNPPPQPGPLQAESPHAHAAVSGTELMTRTEFLSPSPAK